MVPRAMTITRKQFDVPVYSVRAADVSVVAVTLRRSSGDTRRHGGGTDGEHRRLFDYSRPVGRPEKLTPFRREELTPSG